MASSRIAVNSLLDPKHMILKSIVSILAGYGRMVRAYFHAMADSVLLVPEYPKELYFRACLSR